MERNLTPNEIEEAVTTARITSPIITEAEYPWVVELHRRLKEPGYLEAVQGLAQMERELGTPATQAVARYWELVAKLPDLKAQEASARKKKAEADMAARESQKRAEAERDTADRIQRERERLQRELAAHQAQARRDTERLDAEVRMAMDKAATDKAEIAVASELKAQLEARGLSHVFVLDLVQEVPDDEGARERLAAAIQEHGKLHLAIATTRDEKASVEDEITVLRDEKTSLEESRRELKEELTRLRADVAHDKKLREFHRKLQQVAPLMEYISTWGPLAFRRVQCVMSPVYRVLTVDGTPLLSPFGTAAPWTWDTDAYKAMGLPPEPVRFTQ